MKEANIIEVKKWYESKTLLLAVLTIIGGTVTWATGQIEAGVSITVMSVLMTIMRLVSTTKLE